MDKEKTVIRNQKLFIGIESAVFLVFVILAAVYFFIRPAGGAAKASDVSVYINPSLSADLDKHYIVNFKPLDAELAAIQSAEPQKTYIYFDYLNNAVWVGKHAQQLFPAASMIKVPLAMAVLKAVEDGKLSLSQIYTLEELNLDSRFGDLYKVGAGDSLSLGDLVRIMLVYSDNTAMNALYTAMKLVGVNDPLAGVYSFMGWQYDTAGKIPVYNDIDLKTLSNMFISLYNAGYDNAQDSALILKYLDESDFNDAIAAGLPDDLAVSHKIGVDDPDSVYSDCGIVYVPDRNYILCVGSNGASESDADAFMKLVSKTVYNYVAGN